MKMRDGLWFSPYTCTCKNFIIGLKELANFSHSLLIVETLCVIIKFEEIIGNETKGLFVLCVRKTDEKNEFHSRPHERQTGCIIEKFHAKVTVREVHSLFHFLSAFTLSLFPETVKKSMHTFIADTNKRVAGRQS